MFDGILQLSIGLKRGDAALETRFWQQRTRQCAIHVRSNSTCKEFQHYYCQKSSWIGVWFNSTQFHLISCQFLQLNWVGLGLENATSLVMSKSSNHMVKPCLQVAKDLSAGEQMHLLISPILCACFWSCVCPIITLEQHPNETAARKRKKSHYCMPLSSLSRMCHCSSLDALFTKQAARSMLTKRRVGSNLKGSLNWQVTETE